MLYLLQLFSAVSEILELLLSNGDVITAINFAKKFGLKADLKRPDKFLEVAKNKGDRVLFYSTYKFFENFNATEFNHRGNAGSLIFNENKTEASQVGVPL